MNDTEIRVCIIDSSHGIYIPQIFAEQFNHPGVTGISEDERRVLLSGPDHPDYWDVWNDVEQSVRIGGEYHLLQDCDLFMIRETENS